MIPQNKTTNSNADNRHPWQVHCLVLIGLIAIGILGRWLIEIPNFQPVAAIALFCGFYFRRYWIAFAAVLVIMAISDSLLGGYRWQMMMFVYASLLLPVMLARFLFNKEQSSLTFARRVLFGSLLASGIFFLVSNWAFWQFGMIYPKTAAGLAESYAAALPFLRYTVLSDLAFSTTFFMAWYFAVSRMPKSLRSYGKPSTA